MRRVLILAAVTMLLLIPTLAPLPVLAQGSIQQSGPATLNDALCFVSNGIAKDCGFPPAPALPGVCSLRTVSSGTSDLALTSDCTIAWNSGSASAKTEFLYACTAATKSFLVSIVDENGNAGTYNVTFTPNGSNTINGQASFILAFNRQSQDLKCNGAGNWIVQ